VSEQWDKAVEVWEKSSATDDGLDALFGCIEAVRAEVEQARLEAHARARVIETELSTLVARVKALEESVEDLLHGEAGETDVTVRIEEPEIRVRISHAHTLKERWRCDSTTTEWTGRGEPDWDCIEAGLKRTHLLGIAEAAMRNQDDGVASAVARNSVKALAS